MSAESFSEKLDTNASTKEALVRERYELLQRMEDWLEVPMLVLSFVWLGLLVVELIWGSRLWLEIIGAIIWVIFIIDFAIEFVLAPRKIAYLTRRRLDRSSSSTDEGARPSA